MLTSIVCSGSLSELATVSSMRISRVRPNEGG